MKRIGFILLSLFITISCKAIPLFPFFVDLVGNYNEGLVQELKPLEIDCMYSYKCNCFYTIEAADSYLDDILPYENYPIVKKKVQKDGINMEIYASLLLEEDKTSILCLVEKPEDGLYVIYDETPGNPFKVDKK